MKYLLLLLFFAPYCILANVVCQDSSSCPDGNTCCPADVGGYFCCRYSDAVCCSNGTCCPSGKVCLLNICFGVVSSTNGFHQVSMTPTVQKIPALPPREPKIMPCPGTNYSCPYNSTCCPTGCCFEPDAVCCSDGIHCCSRGSICDVKRQKCVVKKANSSEVYKKKMIKIEVQYAWKIKPLYPAFSVSAERVICPGGKQYCADHNTCCLSKTADWKCCPFPMAACCSDGNHCCPNGTVCSGGGKNCTLSPGSKQPQK